MSGVVLRCPNCGTTRAVPGECEACHEAQVRYYCTNHAPGRWLEAAACPQCGARFGNAARPPAAPAPTSPVRARAPVPAPAPASTSPPRSPYPSAAEPKAAAGGRGRRERSPPAEEEDIDLRDERVASRVARLQDMLRAAAFARRRVATEATTPVGEAAPIGRGPGGCLLRLVLLVVFLFLALVSAPFLFGSAALLRMFGLY